MVYFLFDNPADKKNMEFLKSYKTASFNLMFPKKQCKSVKSMLKFCGNCIKRTTDRDIIICWYDFMGILCWWLCKVWCRKRKIIVLNVLLKNKQSFKNQIARMLYRPALTSADLTATVTSEEYGSSLNNLLGIKKKYILLHDIYHGGYNIGYPGETIDKCVFCGGRNGRDWDFVFQLAQKMPDIRFNVVLPKEQFRQYSGHGGKNVQIKTDIPERDFLTLMCQSSLVLMPLDTEAPAGLIAMFQAAANGKLIISTDTVTTREYLSSQRGVLCKKDVGEWNQQIRYWLEHKTEAQKRALNLQKFLESECSEQKYAEILQRLVCIQ